MTVRLLLLLSLTTPATAQDTPFYKDKTKLLVYRDAEGKQRGIKSKADWQKRRAHILAGMQKVMGPLPGEKTKVALDIKTQRVDEFPKYTRKLISYASSKGNRVTAYLFLPKKKQAQKRPGVVCLHPTHRKLGKGVCAGLGPKKDRAYAVHLVERGYVCIAPDYVHSGDYRFDPYKNGFVSATMLGIWNHMRAVDVLQSLPQVDADRVAAIGHSLGGHNAMFLAAIDTRIKCTISNCGFCSFPTYYGGKLAGWSHKGYMPRIRDVYKLDPARMPFDFPEVIAAIAPRAFLASAPVKDHNFAVQGVKDCIRAAGPVYRLFDDEKKLAANYPNCGHDFPPEVRKVAYEWLDRWMQK